MPADIGCVMWLAPQWPDIQPFIPIYAGVTEFPSVYSRQGYLNSLDDHYNPPADIHARNGKHAFWAFVEFSELMDKSYGKNINSVRGKNLQDEGTLLSVQQALEQKLLKIQQKSPEKCRKLESRLYRNFAMKALATTRKSIKKMQK